ncbi:argininosuccinate synthase, partial [Candidatus Micrarchaeota archaeon CG11_big_fil_rev_8_21_14_0_20_47_5]
METLLQRIRRLSGDEYSQVRKAVVAYSGGVDSTATALLLGELGIEVITVSLDLGQGISQAKRNAPLVSKKNFFFDAKEQLLEYAKKAVWANSMFKGHPNGEGLSRPLIALYLVQAAEKEGAQAVVHGSSGVGNDQFRMDNAIRVLAPQLHIIAPVRDWNLSREDSVSYLQKRKVKIKIEGKKPFSVDENFWCRTIRYGALSEDDFGVPQEAYAWT